MRRLLIEALLLSFFPLACSRQQPLRFAPPSQSQSSTRAAREEAVRFNNLGVAFMEQREFGEAVRQFKEVVFRLPDSAPAHFNLGLAYYNNSQFDGAKVEFQKAIQLDARLANAHFMYALSLRNDNNVAAAIAELQKVEEIDPHDPQTLYFLGTLHARQQNYPAAVEYFRRALEADPNNSSARYNLGTALIRSGKREEGEKELGAFRKQAGSRMASTVGTDYQEQGKYSFAIDTLELEKVPPAPPIRVTYQDVTSKFPALAGPALIAGKIASGPTGGGMIDFDGDGRLDVAVVGFAGNVRLLRNTSAGLEDVTAASGVSVTDASSLAWGDFNNDGRPDFFVCTADGGHMFQNNGGGKFSDVTEKTKTKAPWPALAAAFADVDHDGDLDLLVTARGLQRPLLWINNGSGVFHDIAESAGLEPISSAAAILFSDFNNSRDVDFFLGSANGVVLYSNLRTNAFRNVTKEVKLGGGCHSIVAGDVNGDGFMDLLLGGRKSSETLWINHSGTSFTPLPLPGKETLAVAAFVDFDNDGHEDIFAVEEGTRAPRLFHNDGDGKFTDVTATSFPSHVKIEGNAISVGDFDGDGDLDVLCAGAAIRLFQNDGGNKNHWIDIVQVGTNDSKLAIGTKVEIKTGTHIQKREVVATSGALATQPLALHFGVGQRTTADVARFLWPTGVLQSEISLAANQTHTIRELDRKGTSCPILYAWDGRNYRFITDFLGGSAIGYLVAPATYNAPDSDEYIKVDGAIPQVRDGKLSFTMNDQLEEVILIDQAQLYAVDYPEGWLVFPNERLMEEPPFPKKRLYFAHRTWLPVSARDDHGKDILPELSRVDRTYATGFKNLPFKGYAEEHAIVLDLGNGGKHPFLMMHAWIDYADSTANLAAAQAGVKLVPPYLQVRDRSGCWKTVTPQMGFPAGLPKTMIVDLDGKFLSDCRQVRIVTSMRIYWDQILVGENETPPYRETRIPLSQAFLRFKGYPAFVSTDGRNPPRYYYSLAAPFADWKSHIGWYTRYGEVTELLRNRDDVPVVMLHGDEIRLDFDASRLKLLPSGWKRDYLVFAAGFGKDMDVNSARPDTVDPIPFRKMTGYPYREQYRPNSLWAKYNTRQVKREF
jgi:Flp pilus assembly protein TadD